MWSPALGAEVHVGLLQRPVPTRPLLEALGGRVGRPAGSDLPAIPPPSQACMMTITFLPFTVSAATSQASLRAPGPPRGEGAHSPRRSPLRDADSRVVQGLAAQLGREGVPGGSRICLVRDVPGVPRLGGGASSVPPPSAIPGLPQCVVPIPLSPTDCECPGELGPGFP